MAEERLQKILAQAGTASRRKAEQLIVEGRVTVNGEVLKELGSKADPETDVIKLDGTVIRLPKRHVYIVLNKPREVVTTVSDPQGRKTVMHLLKGVKERVFPVGRLDYHSEGLLLLTTDGEFANRITSPAGHVEKVYVVKANGHLTEEQLAAFQAGIPLSGRRTAPAKIKIIRKSENPWYEVRLMEGRQNQIRIMFTHFHHLVEKLRRVKIGSLTLGGLPPGMWRYLAPEEVEHFQKLITRSEAENQRRTRKPAEVVEEGKGEIARSEYPVLPKERFRRPRFQEPGGPGEHAELRGGDRPVTRRPVAPRAQVEPPAAHEPKPERPSTERANLDRPQSDRPASKRPESRPFDGPKSDSRSFHRPSSDRPDSKRPSSRPYDGPKSDRPSSQRFSSDRPGSKRPSSRPYDGPKSDRPSFQRPSSDRPDSKRPGSRPLDGPKSDRPAFRRPTSDRPDSKRPGSRPFDGPRSDRPSFQRPSSDRPDSKRPGSRPFDGPKSDRPSFQRSSSDRPDSKRPSSRPYDGPKSDRPSFKRPASDRPDSKRPSLRPFDGPKSDRPSFKRPASDRPASNRPSSRSSDGPKSGKPSGDRSGPRKPPSRKPGPRKRDDR